MQLMQSTKGSTAMETSTKSPRRVEAGRQNGALRRPWSADDRQHQRERCRVNQPWKASTGPRTQAGKARAAANGQRNKPNPESVRQLQLQMADTYSFLGMMASLRKQVTTAGSRP